MSTAESATGGVDVRNDAILAAELALGVLDAEARAQAEARASTDDAFAAAAAAWARDLHALTETVAPVAPSPGLWARIERLAAPRPIDPAAPEPSVDVPEWEPNAIDDDPILAVSKGSPEKPAPAPRFRGLAAWRAAAFAGLALAAAALITLGVQTSRAPGWTPLLAARLDTASAGPTLLSPEPLFVAVLDRDRGEVVITRLAAGPLDPRPHELWLTPKGGAPAPLGPIGSGAAQVLRAATATLKGARRGAVLSVTAEPPHRVTPKLPGPTIASGALASP